MSRRSKQVPDGMSVVDIAAAKCCVAVIFSWITGWEGDNQQRAAGRLRRLTSFRWQPQPQPLPVPVTRQHVVST